MKSGSGLIHTPEELLELEEELELDEEETDVTVTDFFSFVVLKKFFKKENFKIGSGAIKCN